MLSNEHILTIPWLVEYCVPTVRITRSSEHSGGKSGDTCMADQTVERDYRQAMACIELTLSLVPLPMSAVLGSRREESAPTILVVKEPLDNSL